MFTDFGRNIFWALIAEFIVAVLTVLLHDDKRKMAWVLGIGTLLAGIIGFAPTIISSFQSIKPSLGQDGTNIATVYQTSISAQSEPLVLASPLPTTITLTPLITPSSPSTSLQLPTYAITTSDLEVDRTNPPFILDISAGTKIQVISHSIDIYRPTDRYYIVVYRANKSYEGYIYGGYTDANGNYIRAQPFEPITSAK